MKVYLPRELAAEHPLIDRVAQEDGLPIICKEWYTGRQAVDIGA